MGPGLAHTHGIGHHVVFVGHVGIGHHLHLFHIGLRLERGHHLAGEGQHIEQRAVGHLLAHRAVFHLAHRLALAAHAHVVEEALGDRGAIGEHHIVALHVHGFGQRLAVDVDGAVHQPHGLARQAYASLHIGVAAVDRAPHHLAVGGRVAIDGIGAVEGHQVVEVGVVDLGGHRVAAGEVKDHNIAALHLAHALEAVVAPLRPLDVALDAARQRVLRQGEVQRRLRHARPVNHLVDPQVVAREQCLLERRRRYLVVLPHKEKEEVDQHQGIHDGIDPAHDGAHCLALAVFPPVPRHILGEIDVGQQGPEHHYPPAAQPGHPGQKDDRHNGKTRPPRGLHPGQALAQAARLPLPARLLCFILTVIFVLFHNMLSPIPI